MRILHVGKYYPPHRGGMETALHGMAEGLLDRGCEVSVVVAGSVSWDRSGPLRRGAGEGEGRLVRAANSAVVNSQPATFSLVSVLRRELARSRPQLLHLHLPNPLAVAAWEVLRAEGSLSGVATAVWYHADITRQRLGRWLLGPALRRCLQRVEGIAVSSAALAASSPVLRGVGTEVRVIPFGIDPSPWCEVTPTRDGPFLFVGRLVSYKGLDQLLQVIGEEPDLRLDVVGAGPRAAELRREAARLGGRVRFPEAPTRRDLAGLMANARALVLPSIDRSETFGLVQLEAMAAGLPVVATDLPTGVRTVGVPDETCLLVPPRDPRALGGALLRLARDNELCRRLGDAGRRRFRERFVRDRMIAELLDWYATLAPGGRPA